MALTGMLVNADLKLFVQKKYSLVLVAFKLFSNAFLGFLALDLTVVKFNIYRHGQLKSASREKQ